MKQPFVEGEDYYWKGSLVVFTEKYHLDRCYCCGMGCQHCPYLYESVPEPKRTDLLNKQAKASNNSSQS